MTLIFRR